MKTTATPRSRSRRTIGEEVVDLVRRERRGRLVHDQQACARGERLRDLEQLPVGDAEARARGCRARSRRRARSSSRVRLAPHRPPVDRADTAVAGARPAKTFSATVRSWKTVGSWYMATIPSRCAALRVADRLRLAVDERPRPRPASTTPVRIFTSVDLPAPFSPTSACTLAARSTKLTSSTACTPP